MSNKRLKAAARDPEETDTTPEPTHPRNGSKTVVRALFTTPPHGSAAPVPHLQHLTDNGPATKDLPGRDTYFVKDKNGLVRIKLEEILFLQADGNYVEMHLVAGRMVLRNSMADLMKMLPVHFLRQVNRSQAVNVIHIDHISHEEVLLGTHSFTLTKRYRESLMADLPIINSR